MKFSPTDSQSGPSRAHPSGSTIRLTITGLILLCAVLIGTTTWITRRYLNHLSAENTTAVSNRPTTTDSTPSASGPTPAWGNLITVDIDIEQPMEYVSMEDTTKQAVSWTFSGTTHDQTLSLMKAAGMTDAQCQTALTTGKVEDTAAATIVHPDDELIFSLTPEVRSKLYATLAQWSENKLMREPYHVEINRIRPLFEKNQIDSAIIDSVIKLSYTRGNYGYFSDVEPVLRQLKSAEDRSRLLKCLTYQTAVLTRLRLDQNTDIDKLLGYWCASPGVRAKDLRPLLESIKNTPGGSTISLLYLLPPFARERLYTFPMPSKPGDPKMDCHWTALNFFNEVPDNRLQDNAFASQYIQDHLYVIGKPSMCGDLIFLLDNKGEVIHSAVYIADDIVFTKNGINYGQPWILMRMKNLMGVYTCPEPPKAVFYRRKEA